MTIKEFIFTKCVPFVAKPLCFLVLLVQMAILDYFLIAHTSWDVVRDPIPPAETNDTLLDLREPKNVGWYLWVIPDVLVLALFIVAFVKSHQHLKKSEQQKEEMGIGGELPFAFISWFVYSVFTATKVALIFRWTVQLLDEKSILGPNLVKVAVSLCGVVFVLLVMTHHIVDKKDTGRASFITLIQHSITMDILDTTEILQVIIIQESHVFLSFMLHRAIIAVACINLILPTIMLFALSKTRFGKTVVWQKRISALHRVVYVALVNIPLLTLRSVIWNVHQQTISVFIVKNCIAVGIMIRTIFLYIEAAVEEGKEAKSDSVELQPLSDKDDTKTGDTGSAAGDDRPASSDQGPAVETKPGSDSTATATAQV